MSTKNFWLGPLTVAAVAVLSACGGSDGPERDPVAGVSVYGAALAQMNSAAGVNSPGLQSALATDYLDAGTTRAQVLDALAKDATGFSNADFSGLPMAGLVDASVTACNPSNVCTLTGTLTNADADTTSVPFSTQVVLENGTYRVLGDQKSS